VYSNEFSSSPPPLHCRSAILFDLTTKTQLFEKNADENIPPASMTKLMSLHVAFSAIDRGFIRLDDVITISDSSSFTSSPPHSSLMFLEKDQSVTMYDLMAGLAIPSGNDASIALAEAVSGTVNAFVEMMNDEARSLGLTRTRFVEPSGYSDENQTTAREFARFCMYYIEQHPASLDLLHSLEEFTYPQEKNLPPGGSSVYGPVTQYNHNNLIGRLIGVDGLKTGYIDESGFNLAVTAERQGRRLLAVTMGGPSILRSDGNLVRALDATALLTYGFTAFVSYAPRPPELPEVRIWKSNEKTVSVKIEDVPMITIDRTDADALKWEFSYIRPLVAPLEPGTIVGTAVCRDSTGAMLFEQSLVTTEGALAGSLWRRLMDSLKLLFRRNR
jgi:D-alanyl-D-alanine carboxypeptidase (penicillin-binding protein 5/6)